MVLILNRIVIQSFAWIILATFLGTIMYLFWKVVEKFVEKCGYVDINYFIWKIVILLVADNFILKVIHIFHIFHMLIGAQPL